MTVGCLVGVIPEPEDTLIFNGTFASPVVPKPDWYQVGVPTMWTGTGYVETQSSHNYGGVFFPVWGGSVTDVSQLIMLGPTNPSSVSQTVHGLIPGETYTLGLYASSNFAYNTSYFYVLANGALVYDSGVRGKSNTLWYSEITYSPSTSDVTFSVECRQITSNGRLELAKVSLTRRQRLSNYDFSSPNVAQGYVGTPVNWTGNGSGVVEFLKAGNGGVSGISPRWDESIAGSQCVNWGDGGGGVTTTSLSQTLSGLVIGNRYTVTYYAASRNDRSTNIQLVVSVNGVNMRNHGALPRTNQLPKHTFYWYATSTSATLSFQTSQVTSGANLVLASVTFRG